MPQVNIRCTSDEKTAWETQAAGNISGWLKELANAEVARKGGVMAKVSQKRRGRPKKPLQAIGQEAPPAPKMPEGMPVANTAAEMAEKLAQIRKPIIPLTGPEIPGEAEHRAKYVKPLPAPPPSSLPKAFQSVLDRVKLPSQIKHDPTAAQGKPGKK